ncbi:hypothetical protein WUBG_00316 [Wuchereria bancrofti]|uniref:Uncharacterized protein n=1 Tax=Wuchereria bancrofti TaxID=6293 RepID=J9FGJ5_WUCBA|nr:hypothetical protein WUBG_00316 [Wuchereria bancrofti]
MHWLSFQSLQTRYILFSENSYASVSISKRDILFILAASDVMRKNNPRYSSRPEENHCLPESSYTATLNKLKEEGVLIIRPEDCERRRFRRSDMS